MEDRETSKTEIMGASDDFEFDEEIEDLFEQIGDILSIEAKESEETEENEVNEVIVELNQESTQGEEGEILAESNEANNADITSLAKSVFEALQFYKQGQSMTATSTELQVTEGMATHSELVEDVAFSHDLQTNILYAQLKEKHNKRHKRGHSKKERKSKEHKHGSHKSEKYKLLQKLDLLNKVLHRRKLVSGTDHESTLGSRRKYSGSNEYLESLCMYAEERNREHAKINTSTPLFVSDDDLRNKLTYSGKRFAKVLQQKCCDSDTKIYSAEESKRHTNKKLNNRDLRGYESKDLKSRGKEGLKLKHLNVSSSDDVNQRKNESSNEDIEPVTSSTSASKCHSKRRSSNHDTRTSSTLSLSTLPVMDINSLESEIVSSVNDSSAVKKSKKHKKKDKARSSKKMKATTDRNLLKAHNINSKSEERDSNEDAKSILTYEDFDIAPFVSGNLDVDILSSDSFTDKAGEISSSRIKNNNISLTINSHRRDSIDSVTSAKTVVRSKSMELISSEASEAVEVTEQKVETFCFQKKEDPSVASNEKTLGLSDFSLSPCSEASFSKVFSARDDLDKKLVSNSPYKRQRTFRSRNDSNSNVPRPRSPQSINKSLSSSSRSKFPPSSHYNNRLQSPKGRNRSKERESSWSNRIDSTSVREMWRNSSPPRRKTHKEKSPSRITKKYVYSPPHKSSRHSHDDLEPSYYRKRSRSRSPLFMRSRSPFKSHRSRSPKRCNVSRSPKRCNVSRSPYQKFSRSRSPLHKKFPSTLQRKRSVSPQKRKSRSPYKMRARSRSPYRRSFSISPPRRVESKSPFKKRFEAAVANFLSHNKKKTVLPPSAARNTLMDRYTGSETSFTVTATAIQQVFTHMPPVAPYSQGMSYSPQVPCNYSNVPRTPYPCPFNMMPLEPWSPRTVLSSASYNPPPPGVAPYPDREDIFVSNERNISPPVPVPISQHLDHSMASVIHVSGVPLVKSYLDSNVTNPSVCSRNIIPVNQSEVSLNTVINNSPSPTTVAHLDLCSPSTSPKPSDKNTPIQNPLLINIVDNDNGFSSPVVPNEGEANISMPNKNKMSPIVLRLKKHLKPHIPCDVTENNDNQSSTTHDLNSINKELDFKKLNLLSSDISPTTSERTVLTSEKAEHNATTTEVVGTASTSTASQPDGVNSAGEISSICSSEQNKANESMAIPVAALGRTKFSDTRNTHSPSRVNTATNSNRILIDTAAYSDSPVISQAPTQAVVSHLSTNFTSTQILEQIRNLLNVNRRSVSTQVDFGPGSQWEFVEVFDFSSSNHDDLLLNLEKLLK